MIHKKHIWFTSVMVTLAGGACGKPQVPPAYTVLRKPALAAFPAVPPLADKNTVASLTMNDLRGWLEHPVFAEFVTGTGVSPALLRKNEPLALLVWNHAKSQNEFPWLALLPASQKVSAPRGKSPESMILESFFIDNHSLVGAYASDYAQSKNVRTALATLATQGNKHVLQGTIEIAPLVTAYEKELLELFTLMPKSLPGGSSVSNSLRALPYDAKNQMVFKELKNFQRAQVTLDVDKDGISFSMTMQPKTPASTPSLPVAVDLTQFLPAGWARGQINLRNESPVYGLLRTIYAEVLPKQSALLQKWLALQVQQESQNTPVSIAFAIFDSGEKALPQADFIVHVEHAGDLRAQAAHVAQWLATEEAHQAHHALEAKDLEDVSCSVRWGQYKEHGWPVDRYTCTRRSQANEQQVIDVLQVGDYLFVGFNNHLKEMADAFFAGGHKDHTLHAINQFPNGASLYMDVDVSQLEQKSLGASGEAPSSSSNIVTLANYQDRGSGYTTLHAPRSLLDWLAKQLFK